MRSIEAPVRIPMSKKINLPDGTEKEEPVFQFSESYYYDSVRWLIKGFRNSLSHNLSFINEVKSLYPDQLAIEYFNKNEDTEKKKRFVKFKHKDSKFEVIYNNEEESEMLSIKRIDKDGSVDSIMLFAGKPKYDEDMAINEGQIAWTRSVDEYKKVHDEYEQKKVSYHRYFETFYNDMKSREAANLILGEL
jgi:hypothetical protein